MLFIRNLEPIIRSTSLTEEVRILSVLNSGNLSVFIDHNDLGLKNASFFNMFKAVLFYQDLMMEHFALFYNNNSTSNVSCIHAFPGAVATGFADELPWYIARTIRCTNILFGLMKPEVCADYMVDNGLLGEHMSAKTIVPNKSVGFHTMTSKGQVMLDYVYAYIIKFYMYILLDCICIYCRKQH